MNFFVDRNISMSLARMLAIYSEGEHEVRHLDQDDRFCDTTEDVEWITSIGAADPPWIALSADLAIMRRDAERKALEEANLTFFGFDRQWLKLRFPEQAWRLVKAWPDIVARAEAITSGHAIFRVHWGSRFEIEELGRHGGRSKA